MLPAKAQLSSQHQVTMVSQHQTIQLAMLTSWGLAVGAVYYDRTLADFSNRAGTTPLTYVTAPGAYFEGDGDLGIRYLFDTSG